MVHKYPTEQSRAEYPEEESKAIVEIMLRKKTKGNPNYSAILPSYANQSWENLNPTAKGNIETTWRGLTDADRKKILLEIENPKKDCLPKLKTKAKRTLAGFVDIIAGTSAVTFQVVTAVYPIPFEKGAVLLIIDGAFLISFVVKWTCYRNYASGNLLCPDYKWQGWYTNESTKSESEKSESENLESKKFKLLIFLKEYKYANPIIFISFILLVTLNTATILRPDQIILSLVTIPFTAFASAFEPWLYDFIALFEDGSSPDVEQPVSAVTDQV